MSNESNDHVLSSAWRSPSNIALIKYWGKHGDQLPDNPSVSITLSNAYTDTRVTARAINKGEAPEITFHFEGKKHETFEKRVSGFVKRMEDYTPFIKDHHLVIESENSFPHSSGIASSASALSALALCLADLQATIDDGKRDEVFFRQASIMARLGSGSACRSVYAPVSIWGKHELVQQASDEFAVGLSGIHPVFQTLRNAILIIDDSLKAVTSSKGHALMQGHPFAAARIAQVDSNLRKLIPALHDGNVHAVGTIAEAEALALHALMMTSDPSFILLLPNSLHVLQRIRSFRESTGIPVYFTLDAGPNVHLLYPESETDKVRPWIMGELTMFCKEGRIIEDHAGKGPEKIQETKVG